MEDIVKRNISAMALSLALLIGGAGAATAQTGTDTGQDTQAQTESGGDEGGDDGGKLGLLGLAGLLGLLGLKRRDHDTTNTQNRDRVASAR
ncbi:MAG TPA: WGxxGxxG family protein [Acidimicrobiales bacterium]|nr:WGxxGxxG family protein [Acidimicrobiales bacterium]